MKDELSGKIVLELVVLRPRAYYYLIDEGDENERANNTKRCVIKQNLKFKDYKNFLEANQLQNGLSLLERHDIEVDNK